MRSLSKKTQYGLRALYALARAYGTKPMLIARLAEAEVIPKKFLEQILLQLKTKGLVQSKKGKGGGYSLSRPPMEITLGTVIRMIDGPLATMPCASETAFKKCNECVDVRFCETRIVMREVRNATAAILDNTTLHDVCVRVDSAREEGLRKESGEYDAETLMYYI